MQSLFFTIPRKSQKGGCGSRLCDLGVRGCPWLLHGSSQLPTVEGRPMGSVNDGDGPPVTLMFAWNHSEHDIGSSK